MRDTSGVKGLVVSLSAMDVGIVSQTMLKSHVLLCASVDTTMFISYNNILYHKLFKTKLNQYSTI